MEENRERLFPLREAAARLSVTREYLYRLIRHGQVRTVKDDKGRLAIPESELVRLSQERGYMVNLSPARDPIEFATELRAMGYSIDRIREEMQREGYEANHIRIALDHLLQAGELTEEETKEAQKEEAEGTEKTQGQAAPPEEKQPLLLASERYRPRIHRQASMPPGGSYAIDESALSEKARNLLTVLSTVSGLAPNMLRNLIMKYNTMPDLYDNNPGFLYNDLVNAGVPWYKAMNILTQFYHLVNPSALQSFFPFPSNSNLPTPFMPPFMPGAKIEDEEEKEERKAQKRMERMMSHLLMVATIKSLGGAPSQPSFMQLPPIPGIVYRPVLDKDGKPLKDEMGQPIYEIRYMPHGDGEHGGAANVVTSVAEKAVEALKDLAVKQAEPKKEESERESLVKVYLDKLQSLNEMLLDKLSEAKSEQIALLRERLQNLEQTDPVEYVKKFAEALKEAGFWGKSEDMEVAKLKYDLEKWKAEKDIEFKKWLTEQKQAMEDKKYAREQLRQLSQTSREAISKVLTPIAEGVKEGVRHRMTSAPSAPAAPQSQQKPLEQMSDEELEELASKIAEYEGMMARAKKRLHEELKRRGKLKEEEEEEESVGEEAV